MRHWRGIAVTSGLIAIAFVLGVWSESAHWAPATFLARVGDPIQRLVGRNPPPPGLQDEPFGRRPVPCPATGERTMVALVFGQSQAANQVQERFVGGKGVFNYLRGRCYQAVDPLLGTGGDKGNVWTLVATDLVAQKQFDAVILVTIAIGGTSIAQWAPGGRLNEHLMDAVTAIAPVFPFTHVFIAQGETDFLSQTPPDDYFRNFAALIASLRHSAASTRRSSLRSSRASATPRQRRRSPAIPSPRRRSGSSPRRRACISAPTWTRSTRRRTVTTAAT